MDEVAKLGLSIDSSDAEKASANLGNLAKSAEKAETAVESIGESFSKTKTQTQDFNSGIDKGASTLSKFEENSISASSSVKDLNISMNSVTGTISKSQIDKHSKKMKEVADATEEATQSNKEYKKSNDGVKDSTEKRNRETEKAKKSTNAYGEAVENFKHNNERANKSIKDTSEKLKQVKNNTDSAGPSISNLGTKIVGLAAAYISLDTAFRGVEKLFEETVGMELFNARLKTATGSAENATIAFAAIKDFATETPFDLNQVTDSFTKLVNYGLTPSERALRSYGNTSSALGKSMEQMIEAVADASTGEFERLKEFGIKAKKEGDSVQFTFRGVTQEVKNNATDIENYLINLGEVNFAGSMQEQMDTLGGAASNLDDAWQSLFMTISSQGSGDIMKDIIRGVTAEIQNLEASIASGQFEAYLEGITIKFSGFAKDIENFIGLFESEIAGAEYSVSDSIDFIVQAFSELPENLKAMIQILTIEFASGFEKFVLHAGSVKDRLSAIFTDDTIENVDARLYQSIARVDSARIDSISLILDERDAAISNYDAQIKKANELRDAYDASQKANAPTGDRLEQFGIGKKQEGPTKDESDALAKLRNSLLSEKEEIDKSFKERQDLLAKYLESGFIKQDEYNQLSLKNIIAYNNEVKKIEDDSQKEKFKKLQEGVDRIAISALSEVEAEKLAYSERVSALSAAREAGLSTIMSYDELERRLAEDHQKKLADIENKGIKKRTDFQDMSLKDQTQTQLSNLLQFTQSAAQYDKNIFEANKIAGIANAAISTQQGAAAALEWGWPLGPIFAGYIIASGLRNMQAIKNQQFGASSSAPSTIPYSGGTTTNPVNYNQNNNATSNLTAQQTRPPINFYVYGNISGNDAQKLWDEFKIIAEEKDYTNFYNVA